MTETQQPLFSDGEKTPESVSTVPSGQTVVRLADGRLVLVNDADIRDAAAIAEEAANEPEVEPEVYLHLADGSVERVKESEIPPHAGTNASLGHFKRDGFVYVVTGVYPVETKG